MADDIEVHIDFAAGLKRVGTLHRQGRRGGEAISFDYHPDWLGEEARFSLEPALTLDRGAFAPLNGQAIFGSIGDSAPDTWGRRLMQRAERRLAERENRPVRTLMEADYLLGVADISRLGALRFRRSGDDQFQAPVAAGVPGQIELGRLLQITERILRDEETDDYSIEVWEAIALRLAVRAGIRTSAHELIRVAEKPVLLSRRFDRDGAARIPFLSALSMMGLKDGERGSYPELVDVLTRHGAHATADAHELYRRMVFNVLISNVDDHLRNHGFLWTGRSGWTLSPAFDLNPTPIDVRQRILTTNIDLDEGTCDLDLVLSVAGYFGLAPIAAKTIIKNVATATATWRDVAAAADAAPGEIRRMASAFEHADLTKALAL